MLKEILKMGNPLLLQQSQPILPHEFGSQELQDIIQDLQDTRLYYSGLGIAAPQIGILKQIIIIEYSNDNERYKNIDNCPLTIVINPTIKVVGSDTYSFAEGCLSVPGLKGEVTRHSTISYQYFDFYGNKVEGENNGFFARVMQHECDHLQGILYPMKITDFSKFGFIEESKTINKSI